MRKVYYILYILVLASVLCTIQVSALDLGNAQTYDSTTNTATLDKGVLGFTLPDWLGGGKLADVTLNTPLKYDSKYNANVIYVDIGNHIKVQEINISATADYTNALQEIQGYDKLNGDKLVTRNYSYEILNYVPDTRPTRKDVCSMSTGLNGTINCQSIINGSENYMKEVGTPLSNTDLKQGQQYRVGIFTDTHAGDVIDVREKIMGIEMNQWNIYVADTALLTYWNMSEGSGNISNSVNGAKLNGTLIGSWAWNTTSLGNNKSVRAGGTGNNFILINDSVQGLNKSATYSIVLNTTTTATDLILFSKNDANLLNRPAKDAGSGNWTMDFFIGSERLNYVTNIPYVTNNWTMITCGYNVTIIWCAINGQLAKNSTGQVPFVTRASSWTESGAMYIGFRTGGAEQGLTNTSLMQLGIWNRSLADTTTDLGQLYNGGLFNVYYNGTGLQNNTVSTTTNYGYTTTLSSPANNTNYSQSTVSLLNASLLGTSENNSNSTLLVWFPNSTLFTSIFNTTSGNITIVQNYTLVGLQDANFSWNVLGCGGNTTLNNCTFAPANFTFNVITIPSNITFGTGTEGNNTNITTRNNIVINVTAFNLLPTDLSNINITLYNSTSGIVNSTSSNSNPNYINITGLSDGNYFLNGTATSINGAKNYTDTRVVRIDITIPRSNIITPLNNSYVYTINSTYAQIPFNATDTDSNLFICAWNSTWSSTLTNVPCNTQVIINTTNVFGKQQIFRYVNDTFGNSFINSSIIYINKILYPTTTFETQSNVYSLELWNNTNTISAYNFTFNGVTYTPSISTIEANRYSLNYTVDVPTSLSTVAFYWNYLDSIQRATPTINQTINSSLILGQCNTTLTTQFWNITFKNETLSLEPITASITSSLNYWLGSGSTYKTLSYTNTSESGSYIFCSNPSYLNLTMNGTLTYYNSVSLAKTSTITNQNFSNVTTNTTLYLLPSILGIYARFITLNSAGGILSGVSALVTRVISGNTITIGSGVSDSSGLFTIFVDPTASYNFAFTKTAYNPNLFTITPNNNQNYNVYMTSTNSITQIVNGSNIANNLSTVITPSNSTLNNNTLYSFGFNVTGNNIIFISENITNSTGQQQGYISGVSGFISTNINTNNNTFFIGTYQIQTTTENLSLIHTWGIGNYYVGTYSLYKLMTDWSLYGFQYDYYRVLFMLIILLGTIGGLSKIEVTDTSESKVWAGVLLVWAFSYVGWITIPILVSPAYPLYALQSLAAQYGVAILATIGSFIVIKEVIS